MGQQYNIEQTQNNTTMKIKTKQMKTNKQN